VYVTDDKMKFLCAIYKSPVVLGLQDKVTYRHLSPDNPLVYFDSLNAADRKFDIILVDGEPSNYRCDMLVRASKYLKPGGIVIADNWRQPEVWDDNTAWCADAVEAHELVRAYCHGGWPAENKPPHLNGWITMWYKPGEGTKKGRQGKETVPTCIGSNDALSSLQ
jgi:hypothetical protein